MPARTEILAGFALRRGLARTPELLARGCSGTSEYLRALIEVVSFALARVTFCLVLRPQVTISGWRNAMIARLSGTFALLSCSFVFVGCGGGGGSNGGS